MMTPERWRVVKSVVQEALERPEAARNAFVLEACGGDDALRAEVDSLLTDPETQGETDDFLASPDGLGAMLGAVVEEIAKRSTGNAAAAGALDEADVAATRSAALSVALAGRYEIERTLGRGGMATVYLARDVRHRRRVALKVLHPELGALLGPRRFLREIETAANLSHPHILPLHDSGRVSIGDRGDGILFYVMPYVAGESLRARLRREGRLVVPDALRILMEVAAALDYAHRHGVVHRDVKPENILLDEDGHALVADFGIARVDQVDAADELETESDVGSGAITERGRVIGTPTYMSPEQARGWRALDGRSDQYSLACVAFELLAGAAPYAGTSAEQLASRPTQAPASLAARRPDLLPATDTALARALAVEPRARFDTTSAFAEALSASMANAPSADDSTRGAALDGAASEAARPSRRQWRVIGAGLVAASALVFMIVLRAARATPTVTSPPVLAVLPFENLGPPSDAYFADGLTDELTGRLAAVSGLRVIASASARHYKGSTKKPREIARELGATHLLTGTVRWERTPGGAGATAGTGRVRVRPELVRASDHATVWTEPVEGSLEDVFLVQANVAESVAASLNVALLARERRAAASPPTHSMAAYDAYLRALATMGSASFLASVSARRSAVAELARAVTLDPTFIAAHAKLAWAYRTIHFVTGDPAMLAQARASAERAWALDSTAVDSRHLHVAYLVWAGDIEGARRAASAFVAAAPGLAVAHAQLGGVEDVMDHVDAAITSYQRAATLDPRSTEPLGRIATLHQEAYRYAESARYRERELRLDPAATISYWNYMMCQLSWRVDTAAARRVAERGGPALEGMLLRLTNDGGMAALWHQVLGPAVWRARDTLSFAGYSAGDGGLPPELYLLMKFRHFALTGRPERMRAYADSAVAQLEPALRRAPDVTLFETYSRRSILAEAYARLERAADAGREIERYLAEVRAGPRPNQVANALVNAAYVHVLAGQRDEAVARLAEALRLPSGVYISPAILRADASWAPLRGHPGFERLLASAAAGR